MLGNLEPLMRGEGMGPEDPVIGSLPACIGLWDPDSWEVGPVKSDGVTNPRG